jgi:Protein of unknown function (DUF3800)
MAPMEKYTLYLDSCGDPGWNKPFGKSPIKYYVVAGLALTTECDLVANMEVERILGKYLTLAQWLGFERELCYHHLIQGKGAYEKLTHEQRLAMANEVFDLLLKLKPILFASVINKPEMKERYGVDAHDPKLLGIRATIHRFGMSLKARDNAVGDVMMDAEEYRKDHLIQELVKTFKSKGVLIKGWNYQPNYNDKLERILNTISFADSTTCAGIQLADFCCRTTWQHYEEAKSNRFAQLSPLWDNKNGRVYEPCEIPKPKIR